MLRPWRHPSVAPKYGTRRVAKLHALSPVRSRFRLPCNSVSIRGETVAADHSHRVPGPIDFDQRNILLLQPRQHAERDVAAAVQHDDPRRKVGVAFEEAIGLLLLRVMGEAVADKERSGIDPKRDAMPGQDQRIT